MSTNKKMKDKEKIKFSELDKLLNNTAKPILTLDDMILLLLYVKKDKPIVTRTLLFKELFLFYKEIIEKLFDVTRIPNPNFIGYKYGPFSFSLAEILTNLWFGGYIEIKGRAKGRSETFVLTKKGIKKAKESLEKLPDNIKNKLFLELREKRIGWDQLGRDGILRYVYNEYPEYKSRSKIKEKYRVLKWGQLLEE